MHKIGLFLGKGFDLCTSILIFGAGRRLKIICAS